MKRRPQRAKRAPSPSGRRTTRAERGIVLAIVLVLIFALITAVYAFQRRAIIDATISRNRVDAAEADGIAKGGLRIAETLVALVRAKQVQASSGGDGASRGDDPATRDLPTLALPGAGGSSGGSPALDALWQGIRNFPIDLGDGRSLHIEIEDEGAKLNLNALVPPQSSGASEEDPNAIADDAPLDPEDESGTAASEEAIEYLEEVLAYIIDGMERPPDARSYDPKKIAENILDFIDGDSTAVNGRNEDEYYRRQDPPYRAWNRPLVSVDQLGLVEDVDPALLEALRDYVTVHPIGSTTGINLNRAAPWVLKLVYSGTSGNRRLIDDKLAEDLYRLREKDKLVCDEGGADPRCTSRSDVGSGELGNGSVYPEAVLPAAPTVFRVVSTARVRDITRRFEAIYDTRPNPGPLLLSFRRLRGND